MPYKFNPFTGKLDIVRPAPVLSGYVPYTGATNNLDMGAFGITTNDLIVMGNLEVNSLTVVNGSIQTDINDADTVEFTAYNTGLGSQTTFATLTAGAVPSFNLTNTTQVNGVAFTGDFATQ
jgi:hypothetical protein